MIIAGPKNFQEAMTPLVYFNCFVGMGVLWLPNPSYVTYIVMTLYTIFITIINWTMICFTWYWLPEVVQFGNNSIMADTMFKIIVCANSCITVVAPALVWLRRMGLRACLQEMLIMDKTFEAVFGARNEYGRLYIRLICQVVAIFVVVLFLGIYDAVMGLNFGRQIDISLVFKVWSILQTLHQPIQIMLFLDVNFCTFVGYLDKKFQDINNSLLELTEIPSSRCLNERPFVISQYLAKNTLGITVKNTEAEGLIIDKHYLLREIRKSHLELCSLSRKINLIYGVQNLLSTGVSFVMITGLLYTVYSALLQDRNEFATEVIPTIIWTAIYVSKIWMVNHSCWSVSSEVRAGRTGEVIYKLLNSRFDIEFQKEIQEFSLQMLQNPVHFNACGFFTLDYTFVQGVIGSITTYLVILIQMTPTSDSRGPTSNVTPAWNGTEVLPN